MHTRQAKLFESGGETVKRNLLESYSMQNRKTNNNEDQQLREQVERLTNELINQKNKNKIIVYEDKQIQCEDKRQELFNEIIKQKDRSIEQYEKQILSFKNMMLQSNQQKKELLLKLEKSELKRKSQILQNSQNIQTDLNKNQRTQTQQTEFDLGLIFGVKQMEPKIQIKQQISRLVQTEGKKHEEIEILNRDKMQKELEQQKIILKEQDLEYRRLKTQVLCRQENINKETQIIVEQKDQSIQVEDMLRVEMDRMVQECQSQLENQKQLRKQYNQQTIDFNILKKQYDELVNDYYFIQSESKVNEKKIKELNEEIDQLKYELQSKDPSVSSAETVTSPKDSQKSFKKRGYNQKIKNYAQVNYLNPQKIDELILKQEENQKLLIKISELKKELVENQKNLKIIQEELHIKEQILIAQSQELLQCQQNLKEMKIRIESVDLLEQKLQEQERKYTEEIHQMTQKLAILNSDYLGMKVINQTLHSQIDKFQNKSKQQLQSP
ncbi:unnamed protein product [Paramecium sonneborni]|uniref:Uncharacterized protein n=1 Tax=Paramecium sonneborni TaxID=65129 RepID=A0A8S1N7H2_9CILI|nr:unnamed protein product [Paramecium sonneborni]